MPSVARREAGAVAELTDGGSVIRWAEGGIGDTPATVLECVIRRMKAGNDKYRGSRQLSLAITNAEQALHWLRELQEGQNARQG